MNGKAACRQRVPAGKSGNHNPMLFACRSFCAEKNRFAALQQTVNFTQISAATGNGRVMRRPVEITGGRVGQLLGHHVRINRCSCTVRFHHGNGGGSTSDLCNGFTGRTDEGVCPAAVRLFEIGYAQRNFCVSYSGTGRQILRADVSGFCSMIQNPTPVAGGGKNNHGLVFI